MAINQKKISVVLIFIIVLGGTSLACKTLFDTTADGEGVSVLIVADEGGTVTSADDRLTLEIPAGALDEDTEISISIVGAGEIQEQLSGIEDMGQIYRLDPSGFVFSKPIVVHLTLLTDSVINDDNLSGVYDFSMVTVNEDGELGLLDQQELRYSPNDELPILSGEIDHFSWIVEIDGTLDVAIYKQPRRIDVSTTFASKIQVGHLLLNTTDRYEIQRMTATAFGQVLVYGDPELMGLPEEVYGQYYIERLGRYVCTEVPGIGTYGVYVTALKVYRRNGQVVLREPIRITVEGVVECVLAPTETPEPLPTNSPTLPPFPTFTSSPTMTGTPTATATTTGTATPTATSTSTFRVAMTYAHTQPGVESEVYLHVWGPPGTAVEAQLTGPHVISPAFQTAVIDETGSLTIAWRIGLLGTYVSFGVVGGEDFQISIVVN